MHRILNCFGRYQNRFFFNLGLGWNKDTICSCNEKVVQFSSFADQCCGYILELNPDASFFSSMCSIGWALVVQSQNPIGFSKCIVGKPGGNFFFKVGMNVLYIID